MKNHKFRSYFIYLVAFTIITVLPCSLRALGVEHFKLYNGIEVYFIKNNSPIINYSTWVNAGGIDDINGKEGVAHFLEHMMFKDNSKYTGTKLTKILQNTGGSYNAFTNYDYTVFYEDFPAYYLPEIIKLESARIQGLLLKQDQFEQERKVILEERGLRIDNNPILKFSESTNYYMLPESNYGRSLIGSVKTINSITLDDLKYFYKTYYVPDNIKIFVSGNITFKKLKHLIFRYYNSIPKSRRKISSNISNVPTNYNYNVTIKITDPSVVQPIYNISYLAPNLKNNPSNFLEILSLIILKKYLNSEVNVFYNVLVKQKHLVNKLSINYDYISKLNTNFLISFIPVENVSFNTIINETNKILDNISQNGINNKELQILYNQLNSENVYLKDDSKAFLMLFANLIMNGISVNKAIDLVTTSNLSLNFKEINNYIRNFLNNKKMYIEVTN